MQFLCVGPSHQTPPSDAKTENTPLCMSDASRSFSGSNDFIASGYSGDGTPSSVSGQLSSQAAAAPERANPLFSHQDQATIYKALLIVLAAVLVGALIVGYLEQLSAVDSLYWAATVITTGEHLCTHDCSCFY